MAALTFKQKATTSAGAGTTANFVIPYGSNTTGSSILLALVLVLGSNGGIFSGSDTLNGAGTWSDAAPAGHYSAGGVEATVMVLPVNAGAGGADTVTFSYSLTHTAWQVILLEYTGQALMNPVDAVAAWVSDASGSTSTFGPVTASQTNEQIIAFASVGNSSGITELGGYTVRVNGTDFLACEDIAEASSGSYSPSWTNVIAGVAIGTAFAVKSATSSANISGNAGVGGATISYSGTASGSVTANGAGAYSITGLAAGPYTITPSLAGYTFSPASASITLAGVNVTQNFTATSSGGFVGWSPLDCRIAVPNFGPAANTGVADAQGNEIFSAQNPPFTGNSQTSDNSAIPPTDSRAAGAPKDSRVNVPVNSRKAPPF